MRSQDDEHRRIARNLHDSLGQYLTSIKLNLVAALLRCVE
ncbi:MAG TPA: histidine kinase [Candidatus Polarisedimenticolia bacterium]|nr:histidine kinase [Candidatus Polarisedimenticolia bacterium]